MVTWEGRRKPANGVVLLTYLSLEAGGSGRGSTAEFVKRVVAFCPSPWRGAQPALAAADSPSWEDGWIALFGSSRKRGGGRIPSLGMVLCGVLLMPPPALSGCFRSGGSD